jgi:phosphate transport system substrate-binding protein
MTKTFLGIVGLILICAGCVSQPFTPTPGITATPTIKPDLNLIARDYPRVDGSTSTKPLHTVIACKAFGLRCVWQEPIFSERTIAPDLKEGLRAEANKLFEATRHTGTNPAYMNLINGKTDLILVARAPSEDELNAAKQNRVEPDARPFALDAFVFLVNVKNPVDNLTIENVRDVYTGKITDWAILGGKGTIKAYQRDRNSGSQELMDALVMRGTPMIKSPDMIVETMMGAVNAIGRDPQGVGYSVYYYATFMLPDKNVKLAGVNGVKPTSANIAARAYPLTAPVYAVTRKNLPGNSSAALLRDWLLTQEGQAAVAESGYVPLAAP